jgi:hypothetical protein
MLYKVFGYLRAQAHWRVQEIRRLAGERGQGTVEYVGLILLVSLLMVGMVAAMKGFNRSLSKGGYYRLRRRNRQANRPPFSVAPASFDQKICALPGRGDEHRQVQCTEKGLRLAFSGRRLPLTHVEQEVDCLDLFGRML